ncbi:MAG: cation:proton antiporter [Methanobrevibacter sp.]|jgi:Kef-type K+ transport system membrane component KefB|nr:cation:proton antiporter [Candidatus Methanovirga basalitermitum]
MVDINPLVLGVLILISSLISIRLSITVALIEVVFGVISGNLGFLTPQPWMLYIATFGGVLITFLTGLEIDLDFMRNEFRKIFLIGFLSFIIPFVIVSIFSYFIIGWNSNVSLLAGTAFSETSVSIVYSVLVYRNLSNTNFGKVLAGATFVTNIFTAICLSGLFIVPDVYTLIFYIIAILIVILAYEYSYLFLEHVKLRDKIEEVELKYIFLLLLILIFFADLGRSQAILPTFVLGLLLSKYFKTDSIAFESKKRLKTIAFTFITPIFFIVAGTNISIPLVISEIAIFLFLFVIRFIGKFLGVYFISKKYLKHDEIYFTMLMSTSLTFGLIATVFGLNSGLLDSQTYSILTGVLIMGAIIPTIIAEKKFLPKLFQS